MDEKDRVEIVRSLEMVDEVFCQLMMINPFVNL